MRILLASISAFHPDPMHYYPLSLAFLAPVLRKEGHEVKCLNLFNTLWRDAEATLNQELIGFKPDMVGMNCLSQNRKFTTDAVMKVKEWNKDCIVVLGGFHASIMAAQLLENFPIDFIIKGEGEIAIVELINSLDKKDVKIRQASREVVMDELPMPDHSYARDWMKKTKYTHLITSRGCPGRCIFCATGVFWGQKVRFRNFKLVVDELEMIVKEYGIDDIYFHDDIFNFWPQRCIDISNEIIRRGLKIRWKCVGRVKPVTKEMLQAMKDSGCYQFMMGIESAAPKVMEEMGKGITKEDIRYAFELCKEVGIGTSAFIMVGLPGETNETLRETQAFVNSLGMTEPPAVGLTYVYPGTPLYERAKKEGIINDSFWLNSAEDFVYKGHLMG